MPRDSQPRRGAGHDADSSPKSGHDPRRRRLLALLGAGALAATAGCGALGSGDGDDGDGDATTEPPASSTQTPSSSTASTTTPDPTATETTPAGIGRDRTEVRLSVGLNAGFATATAWMGGDVAVERVTELTREALESALHASGPRLVLFGTSGTIDLEGEPIEITEPNCWVAGQTAGEHGISLVRGSLRVAADDCVVQHLRVRSGPAADAPSTAAGEADGRGAGYAVSTAGGIENVVLDHLSATWGERGALRVGADTADTTVANCLLGETLTSDPGAETEEETDDAGVLVDEGATGVALLANTLARNARGNPRLAAGSRTVVAEGVHYQFEGGTTVADGAEASLVTTTFVRPGRTDTPIVAGDGTVYVEDCSVADPALDDGQPLVADSVTTVEEAPLWPSGFRPMLLETVEQADRRSRGAFPVRADSTDERMEADVVTRTGEYVIDPADVGGYPSNAGDSFTRDVPDANRLCWLEELARNVDRNVLHGGAWVERCSPEADL